MIAGKLGARLSTAAAIGCALATLAACRTTTIGPTTYVTVHAPAPSSTAASLSPSPAPSSTSSSPPVAEAMTKLPGRCEGLLPTGSVVDAVGRAVRGATDFVVGLPDRDLGRVGYINCRYGVSKHASAAKVEIGVSLYHSPAKAAARIAPTVQDYTAHSAHATTTTVKGFHATVLTGGQGADYGPTLVMAVGQRTIAVSLRPGEFAASQLTHDLTALAALATDRTSAT